MPVIKFFPQAILFLLLCIGGSCKNAAEQIDTENPTITCPTTIRITIESTEANGIVQFETPRQKIIFQW